MNEAPDFGRHDIDAAHTATTVIAVVGPTGVGKSALAERIALRIGAEIVSADSMQVYRGMDIGTAKPAPEERLVPYHCLDLVEPGEPFSAALYQVAARGAIEDITSRGLRPVVCGGTGLYVRAALDRMEFPAGDQMDNPARAHYEEYGREHGGEALHALLASRDPLSAESIHVNNTRRVIRALEMLDQGLAYSTQREGFSSREEYYRTSYLGLTMERTALYDRIDSRVDAMVEAGLLGEVETLLAAGLRDALTASQAIGYKELVAVVEERATLADAIETVKRASRRYAKRQLTWFRADPRIVWLDVTELSPSDTVSAALEALDWHDTAC